MIRLPWRVELIDIPNGYFAILDTEGECIMTFDLEDEDIAHRVVTAVNAYKGE